MDQILEEICSNLHSTNTTNSATAETSESNETGMDTLVPTTQQNENAEGNP